MPVLQGPLDIEREPDGRVVIKSAPPTTLITLQFIADSDPVVVKVSGRTIRLADQVTYRVVGWDEHGQALVAEREG